MNNIRKGFTLVEVLAVIVILAILIILVMSSYNSILNAVRTNAYCSKIKTIEATAVLWGQDNRDELQTVTGTFATKGLMLEEVTSVYSIIKAQELIDGNYIKADRGDDLIDPRTQERINNMQIKVYLRNSRVHAGVAEALAICDKKEAHVSEGATELRITPPNVNTPECLLVFDRDECCREVNNINDAKGIWFWDNYVGCKNRTPALPY